MWLSSQTPQLSTASANQLHNLLLRLLDQHAPATQPKVPMQPPSPWINSISPSWGQWKWQRAERQWLKSRLQIHKQIFHAANKLINSIVQQAKFHSIVLKYLPVLLPNNCSALLTVYLVKQNQHICPCLFFLGTSSMIFLFSFTAKLPPFASL